MFFLKYFKEKKENNYVGFWEMRSINRYYRVRGLDPKEVMEHADMVAIQVRAEIDAEERQAKLECDYKETL